MRMCLFLFRFLRFSIPAKYVCVCVCVCLPGRHLRADNVQVRNVFYDCATQYNNGCRDFWVFTQQVKGTIPRFFDFCLAGGCMSSTSHIPPLSPLSHRFIRKVAFFKTDQLLEGQLLVFTPYRFHYRGRACRDRAWRLQGFWGPGRVSWRSFRSRFPQN